MQKAREIADENIDKKKKNRAMKVFVTQSCLMEFCLFSKACVTHFSCFGVGEVRESRHGLENETIDLLGLPNRHRKLNENLKIFNFLKVTQPPTSSSSTHHR